ncbi:hypothetical protein TrLO_g5720 [Triparma laevis f. longispina]|uniref:Uncharacterized protein n=1 Tax=Triparma laevis f. longispina TaxID=1714387 RepID=A0A9W7A9F8_9STRA|nr:hypothetical protein TrLO_g5720 [Triparma laevis f. longispina]
MFKSNQSPILTVSPGALLSTEPPEEIDDFRGRSSLESLDPDTTVPSTIKQPGRVFSRVRSGSGNPNRRCCGGLCCCPHVHVSLTRHFRRVGALLILCGIINVYLCTYYSYMDSNQMTYAKDPENHWQSCIVYAETTATKNSGYNAHFSLSAAAAGQQTLIFSMLAMVTLYRALSHPEWLVSTLAFVFYSIIGCFCFFSFAPAIPFPSSLTANVLTLMIFVKPDMYSDVNFEYETDDDQSFVNRHHKSETGPYGGGICDGAYAFNMFFLSIQYISIALVVALFIIGCLAESRRRKVGLINNDRTHATREPTFNPSATLAGFSFANWPTLKATNMPMFMSFIAFVGFFVMLWGKNHTALIALECITDLINEDNPIVPRTYFPFSAGGLDIVTILFVVSAMAIIRGTTRQRVSAFRLAAAASFLHVVLSYPSVVGGWRFSIMQNLWNGDCEDYFVANFSWLSPNTTHSEQYCSSIRTSLIGQTITFASMHGAIFASIRCYLKNRDHPLELFDPNPPTEARALLFSDNVVRAV